MNIEFRTSFEQDLLEINDPVLLTKIQTTIEIIETVSTSNVELGDRPFKRLQRDRSQRPL